MYDQISCVRMCVLIWTYVCVYVYVGRDMRILQLMKTRWKLKKIRKENKYMKLAGEVKNKIVEYECNCDSNCSWSALNSSQKIEQRRSWKAVVESKPSWL